MEGHLGPDRPPFSQQLNVSPITVHHVSESLTNPILLLLLPGLTVDTAARVGGKDPLNLQDPSSSVILTVRGL